MTCLLVGCPEYENGTNGIDSIRSELCVHGCVDDTSDQISGGGVSVPFAFTEYVCACLTDEKQ